MCINHTDCLLCCRMQAERVMVFIYTHSNDDRGDLYNQEEGTLDVPTVSYSSYLRDWILTGHDQWFATVFTAGLGSLCSHTASTIFMLACGGLINNEEAYNDLRKQCLQ